MYQEINIKDLNSPQYIIDKEFVVSMCQPHRLEVLKWVTDLEISYKMRSHTKR